MWAKAVLLLLNTMFSERFSPAAPQAVLLPALLVYRVQRKKAVPPAPMAAITALAWCYFVRTGLEPAGWWVSESDRIICPGQIVSGAPTLSRVL